MSAYDFWMTQRMPGNVGKRNHNDTDDTTITNKKEKMCMFFRVLFFLFLSVVEQQQ